VFLSHFFPLCDRSASALAPLFLALATAFSGSSADRGLCLAESVKQESTGSKSLCAEFSQKLNSQGGAFLPSPQSDRMVARRQGISPSDAEH